MESNPQSPLYADGSRVLGADGRAIGEVVATYREHLIVERGYFFPANFYIPFSAVANAGGGDIVLALNGRDALAQGWESPPADPVATPAAALPAPPPDPSFPAATGPERPRRPVSAPQETTVAAASEAPAPGTEVPEAPAAAADGTATPTGGTTTPAPAVVAPVESGPEHVKPEDRPDAVVVAAEGVGTTEVLGPPLVVEPVAATGEDSQPVDSAQPPVGTAAPTPDPAPTASVETMVDAASVAGSTGEHVAEAASEASTEPGEVAAAPPPFVGIPGRRLTDAELWSLLDPKEGETAAAAADETIPDSDQPDLPAAPEKPKPS